MPGNARLFQESITQELDSIKNRVRNLIGDAQWAEEGRYKEAVLRNILRKFLPNNISVGTGFILKATGDNDAENVLSSQLDIIIYDNTKPVLFSEGDFIITTLSNVKGIIEVKSRITDQTLRNVIQQFDNSIRNFLPDINADRARTIFTGVFSFEFQGNIGSDRISTAIRDSLHSVNHISLGTNIFIKRWSRADRDRLGGNIPCPGDFYNLYEINGLSFSYFISNLIHITSGGLNDRYWFSFPIQGTKETNRRGSICI
jgi:hypothetical protein